MHGLLVRDNNLIGFGSGRCGGGSRCHRVIQLKILGDLRVRVILWGLRITGHVVLLVVEGRSAGRLDVQPIGKCLLHWLVRRLVQTCRLRVKLISIVRVVHVGGCGHLLLLLRLLFLEQALLGHEFKVGLLLLLRIGSLFHLIHRGAIVRLLHGLAERGYLLRLRINNVAPLIDK